MIYCSRKIVEDVVDGAKKCKLVLRWNEVLTKVDDEFQEMTEITDPGKAQICGYKESKT